MSAYIDEALERAKTTRAPIRLVIDNDAPIPLDVTVQAAASGRNNDLISNEAKILAAAQFHASFLITSNRPGDLLAFASRLEAEVKKFREAARTA